MTWQGMKTFLDSQKSNPGSADFSPLRCPGIYSGLIHPTRKCPQSILTSVSKLRQFRSSLIGKEANPSPLE